MAAASARVRIPVHRADLPLRRREALAALGLPPDSKLRTRDLYRLEWERTADLSAEQRRERIAKLRLYLRDRTARRFAFGSEPDVEVHNDPEKALSDGPQSLYPEQFDQLMGELRIIAPVLGRSLPLAKAKAGA